MATTIYTVPSTKIVHETKVDFSARHDYCPPIYLVQYDNSIPIIAVTLRNQQTTYKLDDTHEAWIRWRKPDNTFVRKKALGCNSNKNVVYFEVTQQMVMMSGNINPVVELIIPGGADNNPQVASSASFNVFIERNPIQNGDIESIDQYEDPYGNVVYSKSQIDANFYNKTQANNNFYSKSQADNKFYSKTQANNNFYSKSQADKKFAPTLIDTENIADNAVGFDQLDANSVGFPQLLLSINNLLNIINKSNYTLLFDSSFNLVKVYDISSISPGILNDTKAKYAFISNKVKSIGSGSSASIPNVTNVYINNLSNVIHVDSDAFPSSVSVSYVLQSPDFNMLDYIAKDLIDIHTKVNSKYNSSNVELGTATLTPYSTLTGKIKSATCLYEKIGDIVIVNVTVVMNAITLGATSSIALLNMPFSNKSDVLAYDIGISKNGGTFKGLVTKSAWLQFTTLNKQKYDFVADEQVNFSLVYKI